MCAELTVKMGPYKGGSRTVVTARVRLQPTAVEHGKRSVGVKKIADDAKREVEDIVMGYDPLVNIGNYLKKRR